MISKVWKGNWLSKEKECGGRLLFLRYLHKEKCYVYAFFCKVLTIYLGNTCKKVVFQLCDSKDHIGTRLKIILNKKNGRKCNISQITTQKRRKNWCKPYNSMFLQITSIVWYHLYAMVLGPENPHRGPPPPKCNISQIMAQKLPKNWWKPIMCSQLTSLEPSWHVPFKCYCCI